MDGYIDENRWIDLSGLPRLKDGKSKIINWKKSIGHILPFKYNGVVGVIKIVDCYIVDCGITKSKLSITIDKYIPTPISVFTNTLLYCQLSSLVENKIIDKAPWMVNYLLDKNDAYKYSYASNKYILTKCPICGNIDMKNINNMHQAGFACHACSDNVSLPNKIMLAVLTQCDIDFMTEISRARGFDWIDGNYRYDFYFKSNSGDDFIIEMDGHFHRQQDCIIRDSHKTKLAMENKFKLIRIDCCYDNENTAFDYIVHHIKNSILKDLIPLHLVDWDKCKSDVTKSFVIKVCDLWERNNMSIVDIKNTTKLSHASIVRYLKRGKAIGICSSYNKKEAFARRASDKQRSLIIYDDVNNQHVFSSIREAVALFESIFGVTASYNGINTAYNKHKMYKGFNILPIAKEEYEQYKLTNNIHLEEVV